MVVLEAGRPTRGKKTRGPHSRRQVVEPNDHLPYSYGELGGFDAYLRMLPPGTPLRLPLLSAGQERRLMLTIEGGGIAGNRAREIMVCANVRLVTAVAKAYVGRGVAMEDMIQEGALGLLHSVDKFDARRGLRFSTYATHWIRQSIGRAIENKGRTIRVPSHALEFLGKVRMARGTLENELNRPVTKEEIADELNTTQDKVETALTLEMQECSLDAPAGAFDAPLVDLIAEDASSSASDAAFLTVLREELRRFVVILSPREREIIGMRYGVEIPLYGPTDTEWEVVTPMTLEMIGSALQLSRERIRQIEAGAFQKLREALAGSTLAETVRN